MHSVSSATLKTHYYGISRPKSFFEQIDASRPAADAVFDDTFFVTGGGTCADHEPAIVTAAGKSNNAIHLKTAAASSSTLSNGRPRSTPTPLPSGQRQLVPIGNSPEHSSGAVVSGGALSPVRRDVWTADAGYLGLRRLCFRLQPIHDLVSSTLRSIDPSGVFSMYEEWSSLKNRVLSRKHLTFTCADESAAPHRGVRNGVVCRRSFLVVLPCRRCEGCRRYRGQPI